MCFGDIAYFLIRSGEMSNWMSPITLDNVGVIVCNGVRRRVVRYTVGRVRKLDTITVAASGRLAGMHEELRRFYTAPRSARTPALHAEN